MATPRRAASLAGPFIPLAVGILVLYFAREILVPLALALTISFLLTPLVTAVQRLRLGRVPAVLLVILVSVAAVAGIGWIVGGQLFEVASGLPQYRLNIHQKIEQFHAPTSGALGKAAQSVKEIGKELSASPTPVSAPTQAPKTITSKKGGPLPVALPGAPTPVQIVDPPENDLQYFRRLLLPALRPLGSFGVILVFSIFILIKREDLRNRLLRLVGLGQLNLMTQALDDGASRISRYLMMQFLVNALYGLFFGFGLYMIGVPNATLWGVIAAVLRTVPYIGAMAAATLPFVMALAVFNTWTPPVLVLVLYAVLEGVTGNFIEPWLYGTHTGVSSLALLVTTVFWTILWGWAGLILSTPLTVCVIVLGRYVPQLSFLHILLGDEAPLSPDAQFYQRLLAMDPVEARGVAESFLKGRPLLELYDEVLIPALSLAEQDRHKGTLDEAREAFLFLSTGELVAELADYRPDTEPAAGNELPQPSAPKTSRVICVPANDQADEITAAMLAQLLERSGYIALAFPADSAWEESVKRLSLVAEDVVCISAVPPFAFTHARAACQRVRAASPDVKIVIGMWGSSIDSAKAKERFGNCRPDLISSTLAATLGQISAWHTAPTLVAEPELAQL